MFSHRDLFISNRLLKDYCDTEYSEPTVLLSVGYYYMPFLFLLLTSIVVWHGPYLSLNMYVQGSIEKIQTSDLTVVATLLSLLGNKYIVVPALILTSLLLFFQGQRRLAVHFLLSLF